MLAVHAVHQVHVGLDDLFNHLRRGAGSGEALQRGFLGGLRPILVYQIIDIGVLARNRPENGGGGHAGLLGRVKDIAHLDGGIEKLPVGGQFAQDGLLVVDDAMLAAVRAGAHAGVVGIGDGGIHRAHAIDERALIPDAAKAGQLTQGLQILVNHGVFRNDDQMLCLAHMQDLLFFGLLRRLILFIQRRLVIRQRLIRALHVGIQGFIHGQVLLIGCRRGGIGRIFKAEMNLPRSLRKILIPADAHARGKRRAQRCGLVRVA